MQQRDRRDEGEILGVVPPHTRLVRAKRKRIGPRDDDAQRLEEPLGVLVQSPDLLAVGRRAVECVGGPLASVDRRGLLGLFTDVEHKAAARQFGIGRVGRGGQQHGHRAFDCVLPRSLPSRITLLLVQPTSLGQEQFCPGGTVLPRRGFRE